MSLTDSEIQTRITEFENKCSMELRRLTIVGISERLGIMYFKAEEIYNAFVYAEQDALPVLKQFRNKLYNDAGILQGTARATSTFYAPQRNTTVH